MIDPLGLAILCIFGLITAVIAQMRGRNPVGWFFIGIIGGCLGLILVLVLPDLKQVRAKEEGDRREKQRLRELLAQERMKNQAFRGYASNRLDTHDQALGLDTRTGAGDPVLAPPPPPTPLEAGIPATNWFVATPGGHSEGPFHLEELRERYQEQKISDATMVWHESLVDWLPLGDTALKDHL